MSITLTTLQTELQEKLGSTSNIKASTTAQKNALNRALDRMQLAGNWMFSVRKTTFDYLASLVEYSVSNYLGLDDFKDVYRLPAEAGIDENDARNFPGGKNYAVHMKDNGKFLSIELDGGKSIVADALTSLTNDGTWSAVGDAVSLVADLKEYYTGNGSLKFNIDEDADAADYAGIINTTKGVKDLTDFEDRSYFILDVYLPTAADINTIELLWGSDITNYWSLTASAPVDSASFKDGWNRVKFEWSSATETLAPDVSAIDYYEIRANYTAGISDQTAMRFSNLLLEIREQVDLEYFSTYMAITSAGVFQSRFSTGTDKFLGDDDLKPMLLELAYYELIRNTKTLDKGEIARSRDETELMMRDAYISYGMNRSKGTKRINTRL